MLEFKPMNLELHRKEILAFREDSYVCSFGSTEGMIKFFAANGTDGEKYIDWLRVKQAEDPGYAVHVWQGNKVVGQMELGAFKHDPSIGYVNLFYLIPEVRGSGIAPELDAYAVRYLSAKGFQIARLSMSATNQRAFRYYTKMGWKYLGPREEMPGVNYMEKNLAYTLMDSL